MKISEYYQFNLMNKLKKSVVERGPVLSKLNEIWETPACEEQFVTI